MTTSRRRDNQLGYNLIEAAIVLGVAALIVGAIFAAWSSVNSQARMRRAQDQLTVIVNQIRTTYGNRNTLDASASGPDFTNALVNSGLLPDSWIVNTSSGALGNPYGGLILVTPDSMPSSSMRDAMNISFSSVPKEDCYKLANGMLGTGRSQGLVRIGPTTVNNNSSFNDIKGNVCTSGSNTITFLFSLKAGT
jgi:type II secretory pathway pseudopilin PulG